MMTEHEHNCIDKKKLSDDIEKLGWAVMLLEETDYLPSFAYTVGLWKNFNHPEIISFGLPTNTLQIILNDAGEIAKAGHKIEEGKNYGDFFENSDTQFLKVDTRNISDYFGQAINYYQTSDFPAIQLVWTDQNNHFPWDKVFEKDFEFSQPLLDRNANFKFREAKNLGIFTTRQWLELDKPILHVIHDNDGDWQFLTCDQLPNDAKLVALEQMTIKDKTLNEVYNLDYGEQAKRACIGGQWTRTKMVDGKEAKDY
ncbi:DUF4262 domain-containing protein [Flavobacterium branchiophilum]|uniref:DUF4262 domain-containing protein n=1 Tax=Flavobacterium branchiophilum (strain FL-15) TaxID=1034807 RepID=G2Z6U6_FLABF|nr:DUF4262 domain-containing protein [Flavobacterium branchiophilum]CCB68938.1 Protein of unknown function [Flavobacterium branchiophilum FL-15]